MSVAATVQAFTEDSVYGIMEINTPVGKTPRISVRDARYVCRRGGGESTHTYDALCMCSFLHTYLSLRVYALLFNRDYANLVQLHILP